MINAECSYKLLILDKSTRKLWKHQQSNFDSVILVKSSSRFQEVAALPSCTLFRRGISEAGGEINTPTVISCTSSKVIQVLSCFQFDQKSSLAKKKKKTQKLKINQENLAKVSVLSKKSLKSCIYSQAYINLNSIFSLTQ